MTTTLVLGGVRSGKSRHAELLVGAAPALYVATGIPVDGRDQEWASRVRAHQERRPGTWTTVESTDPAGVIRDADTPVLVDCLGMWVTRLLDEAEGWTDRDAGAEVLRLATAGLLESLRQTSAEVVLVSNEVGWGVVPTTPSGRFFRDELGRLNSAVAATAERVHLVVAGRVLDLSDAPVVGS